MSRQSLLELEDGIEADEWPRRCRTLATTVRVNADIGRQHAGKRFHVAAARGGKESIGEFEPVLLVDLEARSRLANMAARAGRELPRSRRIAPNGGCDLLEFQPEHIVQQEGRTLEWGKTFEREHQRQGDVFLLSLLF